MCGRANDTFGPAGWETLTTLFGPLRWELESIRNEVRSTDPIRFVRRAGTGVERQQHEDDVMFKPSRRAPFKVVETELFLALVVLP